MSFCPNCGNKLDSDVNFCPKCGAKLSKSVIDTPEEDQEYYSESYVPERGFEEKFLKTSGRLNPARYILRLTVLLLIVDIIYLTVYFLGEISNSVNLFLVFFYVTAAIPLHIRRAHDMGHSGWYIIFAFIPILGLIFIFKSGTHGENQYGSDPEGKILNIPFEDNPLLALISNIEESSHSALISGIAFLIVLIVPSLIMQMNVNSQYTKNKTSVTKYETPTRIETRQNYEPVEIKLPEKSYTIPNIQPSEEISLTPKINALNKNTATDVLISFHDNITDRNFAGAYNCLSYDFQNYIGYYEWVRGFNTTVSSSVSQIRVIDEGTNYVVLTYILTAVDDISGRIQTKQFNGEATLIKENGFWKIDKIINRNK